jgi:hypothetical protein
MITAIHTLVYSDAAATRAFLRDVLGLAHVGGLHLRLGGP